VRIPPTPTPLVNSLLSLLPQVRTVAADVEAPAPAPQAQAVPLSMTAPSIAMLLAMAGTNGTTPTRERERQVARAAKGLDALSALHAAQARGLDSGPALAELADWVSTSEMPEDAALAEFLRELDLRVRVELAKHERFA
jgi:Class II flagellar assembly regulator